MGRGRGEGDGARGDAFKPLTEAAIEGYTDGGSFSRGKAYYRDGAISGAHRRGTTIAGRCAGSQGEAYRVAATLATAGAPGDDALADWACTCPRGGFCKHVVALTLAWVAAPDRFAARREIEELLAGQSRAGLVSLIERLVGREPDLYDVVERAALIPAPEASGDPAAPRGAGGARTIDPDDVERQVARIFRDLDDDLDEDRHGDRRGWDEWDGAGVGADLAELRATGDAYAAVGRWADAQTVYAAIAAGALDHDESLRYEESTAPVVAACAAGLARCLDAQATLDEAERLDPGARAELLDTLYDIWLGDVNGGGVGLAPGVPEAVARAATAEERADFERRLRAAVRPGGGFVGQWANRAIVGFLTLLRERSGAGDEETLAEYRHADLHADLAALLLDRGRADEAQAVARRHLTGHQEVTAFATALAARGGAWIARALTLVEDRLFESREGDGAVANDHYLGWLGGHYAAHGLPDKALDVALRRLRATPAAGAYEAAKTAAHLPGGAAERWPALRRDLLLALEEAGAWTVLIEIFLREGEPGEALTALGELEGRASAAPPGYGYHGYHGYHGDRSSYQVRVAEAAERDYPDRAREIYRRVADRLIEGRDRGSYRAAAGYLARVRRLYAAQGRDQTWREEIAALRLRHKALRALREELNAQGLE